jgi:hypothetical protein
MSFWTRSGSYVESRPLPLEKNPTGSGSSGGGNRAMGVNRSKHLVHMYEHRIMEPMVKQGSRGQFQFKCPPCMCGNYTSNYSCNYHVVIKRYNSRQAICLLSQVVHLCFPSIRAGHWGAKVTRGGQSFRVTWTHSPLRTAANSTCRERALRQKPKPSS